MVNSLILLLEMSLVLNTTPRYTKHWIKYDAIRTGIEPMTLIKDVQLILDLFIHKIYKRF